MLAFGSCLCVKKPNYCEIFCKNKSVEITKSGQKLLLIDHGALKEKKHPESWITYTLIPTVLKTFGTITFDHST